MTRKPFHFPSPLYPIADPGERTDLTHVGLAEAILAAGAPFLQLRVKQRPTGELVDIARRVRSIADRHGALLIVNDRADVAELIDAAGVHLGQDDLPPLEARRILGPSKIIGFSTHSLEQVEAALAEGVADYLAFGPIFATTSKANPDPICGLGLLAEVRAICPLPLVAIGGITADNLDEVLAAGADAVAAIGAIAGTDDAAAATADLLRRARSGSRHR